MTQKNLKPNNLSLIVLDKQKKVFDGSCYAVSSTNSIGNFDILYGHANFVTVINGYVEIHKTKELKQNINLDRGILKVTNNLVEVFVGI